MSESGKTSRRSVSKNQPQPYSGIPSDDYNDSRDEKPWQRVFDSITRKGIHLYEPVKSVPSPAIIIVLGFYLLLGYLTQLVEDGMPKVVPESSIARDDWQTFSEESARRYLDTILGGQPRVAGTRFHLQKTRDLKDLVDSLAAQATLPVKTDWQFATGNFWMNFSVQFVNYYQNASNVIAVLEGQSGFNPDGSTRSSLLLNCHYDSVPFAQGASDNGVFCAAMAETLSRLSRRKDKFKHNIVFLFNGAEENPLQASHAFLQHPWSRGVTAVINLDSAGMNGKPSVFQVTDPRILRAYQRGSPHPSAQAVGEFLFMSGAIPSDTDFRIWRDFGNIQGIDIAFTKWGHVYHTRNDRADLILSGVIQGAGDTLLALAKEAADDGLDYKAVGTPVVYYDYLNQFVVAYSYGVAAAVDVAVALVAMLSVLYYIWLVGMRRSTIQELLWAACGRVCCLVGGAVLVAVFVPIMVATTVQLRYLSQPWIVVPMFWLPYLVGTVSVAHVFDRWRTQKSGLNRSIRTLQAMSSTRGVLALVLLGMSCVPRLGCVRYVVAVPLLLTSVAAFVSITVIRYLRMQGWHHLVMEVGLSIPAVMFTMMLSLRLVAMMLPVMGRSGANTPDDLAAATNSGMAVLAAVSISGVELLFSRKKLWLPLGVVLGGCVVAMFVPFSPYQDDGPAVQRHYWVHSDMITYNEDKEIVSRTSGLLVMKQDANNIQDMSGFLKKSNLNLNYRIGLGEDCSKKVYCGLPVYRVAFGKSLQESMFVDMGPPASFEPAPDVRLANKTCVADNCTFDFEVTVAPHNLITMWLRNGVNLTAWGLAQSPRASYYLLKRPVYVFMHSAATYCDTLEPLKFTLNLQVPIELQSRPVLDLGHHAHLIHHPEAFTPEYSRLLKAAPAYFNVATFLSIRSDYMF